jgi:hypothetical protein
MCNQVRGFHHSHRVWKFIANRRMTFPNCADINSCLHSYLFPSQTELKVIRHLFDFIIHNVRLKLKVIEHFVRWFSDRCFRPANAALICSLVFERDIEKVYQWWTLGGGGGGGRAIIPLKFHQPRTTLVLWLQWGMISRSTLILVQPWLYVIFWHYIITN